jgi:Ca-activated chloride channel family protein
MNTKTLLIGVLVLFTLNHCSKESYSEDSRDYNIFADRANLDASNTGSAPNWQGEGYNEYEENPWIKTLDNAVSTFSIDADGASYSNTRRFLTNDKLPPKAAIRTEEMINYFNYDYPENSTHPISLNGEIATCPWTPGNKLLRIGLRGKDIPESVLPPSNFVFLIDVSGSMSSPNKLELLKESFKIFVDYIDEKDFVSIVTYSGSSGIVLPPTPGNQKLVIKTAINSLGSGGSTAGAQGIITAYDLAVESFIPGGNNRVIMGTDGDFNVGISDQDQLVELIEEKRDLGVFLTILGVGSGNLQDGKMEQIANNGNGNYEYIDNLDQARKVFVHEFNKFYTVAKDVKIQIDFNPQIVREYRLIGYENRLLEAPDFEDDTKDAGEIGSNQTITAIYEIVPTGLLSIMPSVTIDFRYKLPDSDESIPIHLDIIDELKPFNQSSENMRFATAVAGYGLLLGESNYAGTLTYDNIITWAQGAMSYDPYGFREEFIDLVNIAKNL